MNDEEDCTGLHLELIRQWLRHRQEREDLCRDYTIEEMVRTVEVMP